MINGIKTSYVVSTANQSVNANNKESKTNEAQKLDNDKLSRISQQIKSGEYKFDLNATASAIADSLL